MSEQPGGPPSPLFVLGADHSGTTILYRMLAHHPQLVWFSQFTMRDGRIPGRSRRPGAKLVEPFAHSTIRRFAPHPWGKAEIGQLRRLFTPRPGEEGEIWDHLLGEDAEAADRLRTCLTAWAERFGGRRLLAKRPAFYRHLDVIAAAFPRASFVHIVRDGRPVALSLRDKALATGYIHTPTEAQAPLDPEHALNAGARHWVDVIERVGSHPLVDPVEVRYEDLCADTHGVIRSVLDHAGLDATAFPYSRCPRTLRDRGTHRLEAATGAELAELDELQRPYLLRYGYPVQGQSHTGA